MAENTNDTKPLVEEAVPPLYTANGFDDGSSPSWVIGINEPPPPYQPPPKATVTCRVCQTPLDVTGKKDLQVVNCFSCNEVTPIKTPPPGKKYVRCSCNGLLICKTTSQRIACPRSTCQRIIDLPVSPDPDAVPSISGMSRVTCVSCRNIFIFDIVKNALARCPHCHIVSPVGREFVLRRAKYFFIFGVMMLLVGIGLTLATYEYASTDGGSVYYYFGLFAFGGLFLCLSIYYYTLKVSTIEGPLRGF